MSWLRETKAVFIKEVRTEWRTRVALSGIGLFLLSSVTLIALALAGLPVGPELIAGLLWVLILFTAATGLGRTFVQETERGTALALRLHSRATAVWCGKFAANGILLLGLVAIGTPVLFQMVARSGKVMVNSGPLICVLILGTLAIASVFTTTAALVAQTSARGGLLAALSFPLLVPVFQGGLHGTKAALGYGTGPQISAWSLAQSDCVILGSYTAAAIALSLMLFDYIWND